MMHIKEIAILICNQMYKSFLSRKQAYRMVLKKRYNQNTIENTELGIPYNVSHKNEEILKKIDKEDFEKMKTENIKSFEKIQIENKKEDNLSNELFKINLNSDKQGIKSCMKHGCKSPVSITETVDTKKNLKVDFFSIVNVILIPSRQEYINVKLDELMWWSLKDYELFLENEKLRLIEKLI